jgi:hypothetical protein
MSVPAPVKCAECAGETRLVKGHRIYPHRRDLHDKWFWLCECGAYCGCHPGTDRALGAPAGKDTREARQRAHAAFDPIWRGLVGRLGTKANAARSICYRALARRLGMPAEACHIGMMTYVDAIRVVDLCRSGALQRISSREDS